MSSREDILGRIRRRLGRTSDNAAHGQAALEAHLSRRAQGPQPDIGDDLVGRFRTLSEKLSSTVDVVAHFEEAPAAVAAYLDAHALPRAAVIWPQLADLDWAGAGIGTAARAAVDADLVGITGVFCAVAETASLVVLSGRDTPATTSLLPETHIALVPVTRIVARMEDAWALLRAETGEPPRAVNFISGPSRTGDIEQTLVLGAHGPYRVHIVLVGAPHQED